MAVVGGQTGVWRRWRGCGAPVFTLELIQPPVQNVLATHVANCLSKTRRPPPPPIPTSGATADQRQRRCCCGGGGSGSGGGWNSQEKHHFPGCTPATCSHGGDEENNLRAANKVSSQKYKTFSANSADFRDPNLRRCTAALRAHARPLSFLRP